MIIINDVIPKNIPMSFHVITFLSIVASGNDNPTIAIMKAMAVPMEIPLVTKTCITGTIPAALAYIGTARMTASGTAYQLSFPIHLAKNSSGTNPWIPAPMAIPIRIYRDTPLTMPHASRMIEGRRFTNGNFSLSHSLVSASD